MERYQVRLDDKEREKLEILLKNHTTTKRMAERAKIVLLSSDGLEAATIAAKLDCSARRVCKWKRRYCESGLSGLDEKPRPGRPCRIATTVIEQVITGAVNRDRVTSCRKMAKAAGISPATVQRIWAKNDIKPHVTRTFKLSNDVHFEEKFWDVIGLYLDPPERAVVLCCDEKSQIDHRIGWYTCE